MKLIDTHCHIHFNAYKDDMDEIIKRSLEKGVFMITIGTQQTTSKKGLEVAERYEGLWASVGLHPNHTCEQEFWDDDELPPEEQATPKIKTRCERFDYDYYLALTKHPKCVAIGECGLDYYRIPENLDQDEVKKVQEETVRSHFDLATEAAVETVASTPVVQEIAAIVIEPSIWANSGMWFLIGALFSLLLYLIIEYFKKKR